mgnify:CR=1 FL=1
MFTIDDELLLAINMTEADLRIELAIIFYEKRKLTFEQARKVALMNPIQFQELLYNRNIYFPFTVEDLEQDIETLKTISG